MKGLVLAGGTGVRLRPFSHSTPKQLFPIANKPVLIRCLENLQSAGIADVYIVVGDRADLIRQAVSAYDELGLTITYIQQPEPLGLAHAVWTARERLGDDDFLMYLGDNIIAGGPTSAASFTDVGGAADGSMAIRSLADTFRRGQPAAQLTLTKVDNPDEYGVAELDANGCVADLVEKPTRPRSDLAVMGIYFFTPIIHSAIAHITPSGRGELEITDAVRWLIDNGHPVRGERFDGYWCDTGRIDDLLACNQRLLEAINNSIAGDVDPHSLLAGPVQLGAGARIVRSRITGPVSIGAGTVIENSVIGPYTSIGPACRISGAAIEYSILLDGATVQGLTGVYGSLIGSGAVAGRAPARERRHRLVLGDHTWVEVGG